MAIDGVMTLLFAGAATASLLLIVGRSRHWFTSKMTSGPPQITPIDTSEAAPPPDSPAVADTPIVIEAPSAVETAPVQGVIEVAPVQSPIETPQATSQPTELKKARRRSTGRTRSKKKTAEVQV